MNRAKAKAGATTKAVFGEGLVPTLAPLIFKGRAVRLGGDDEGLPEFEAVAFGVGDPGEAAVVVVFAVGIDGYAGGG